MSKNVKVNDTTYNGVSTVELPLASGSGKAQFMDVDEITKPSGTVTITENGTHDVTNYASAVVNVASEGGTASTAVLLGTATANTDSSTNGKVVFENMPALEMYAVYALRCTEEQSTDVYEGLWCVGLQDIAEPHTMVYGMGTRQTKVSSSGDYTSTNIAPVITVNDDGTITLTFNAAGSSYHFRNGYTYNLYKLGTYPHVY